MTRHVLALFAATTLVPALAAAEDEAPPLSIYGFARLDVLADDSRMSDILQPIYVMREPAGGQVDGELTMTPRMSRLGLGIDEWEVDDDGDTKGEGKLEIDFGGGAGTNVIRLRHAYAQITMSEKVELLAGQTWDLMSPLFPSVQNDMQMLFVGNTGDRRPQLRFTALPSEKVRIAFAAAATGSLDQRDLDGDGQLDGMAAGTPMVQGMIEVKPKIMKGSVMRLGLWGHASRDELADGTRHPSTSVGTHLYLPMMRRVVISGELYTGRNLTDVGGGIGQGVHPMTGRRIRSTGGWIEAAFMPSKRHMVAFGQSGDFVREDDVMAGDRTRNTTVYGMLRYKPKATLQLGLEYLHWRTQYKDMTTAIANRFNMHLSVFF